MNLQQLRYVRALVEEGSFVSAAARCAVAQPTLSNGIAQLESELGQRIFRRTTRSLSLTAVGERLLPIVIETLKSFDRIKELASEDRKGRVVHIGFSPMVGIANIERSLAGFRKKCPDVEIVYREGNLESISEALRSGELDLIVAPLELETFHLGSCAYQHLGNEPLLFLPKKSELDRWRDRVQVSLEEISQDTFVLVPGACGLTQVTRHHFEKASLKLRCYPGEANSYTSIEEWTRLSLGSAILPASKIARSTDDVCPISIIEHGKHLSIDYYALGKANTVSPTVFATLWSALQPFNPIISAAADGFDADDSNEDYALSWAI